MPPVATLLGGNLQRDTFTHMCTQSDIYVGTDDFAKLVLESKFFVDKSLFIREFLDDSGEVALITRPRRWGKTLNMNMLGPAGRVPRRR